MKNYHITIQEETNFCLCSVLQAIFKEENINISQREIAKNLTLSREGFVQNDDKIKKFLYSNRFEYSVYWYNQIPFNEPDMLLSEMNEHHGLIGIGHHVYLLNGFKDPLLQMTNPEDAKKTSTTLNPLRKEMQEKDGFFGLLKYIF
jgi:hypothetical protein